MKDKLVCYKKLIDDEVWAFIDKTNACFPIESTTLSIDEIRLYYNAMCKQFFKVYSDAIIVSNQSIKTRVNTEISLRHYHNKNITHQQAHILYFHGGGFVVGDLNSHDDVCAELCEQTGYSVTSVNYRLAPEHTHPAAFNDAFSAYQYLLTQVACSVILVGDSAGAGLAAAVAHAGRCLNRQAMAQVLIYPSLGGDVTQGSYITHAHAPLLTTNDMLFYHNMVLSDKIEAQDSRYAVLADDNFHDLPITFLFSAECDPLSDDAKHYHQAIIQAGGCSTWTHEKGLVHGYLRARHTATRAKQSFARIINALNALT